LESFVRTTPPVRSTLTIAAAALVAGGAAFATQHVAGDPAEPAVLAARSGAVAAAAAVALLVARAWTARVVRRRVAETLDQLRALVGETVAATAGAPEPGNDGFGADSGEPEPVEAVLVYDEPVLVPMPDALAGPLAAPAGDGAEPRPVAPAPVAPAPVAPAPVAPAPVAPAPTAPAPTAPPPVAPSPIAPFPVAGPDRLAAVFEALPDREFTLAPADPYAELVAMTREREAEEIKGALEAVKEEAQVAAFFDVHADDLLPRAGRRRRSGG
jgi:hypothetical protein